MDEKSTWNRTWQVWIKFVGIVGGVFITSLKGRHGGMCNKPLGTTHDNLLKIYILMLFTLNQKVIVGANVHDCFVCTYYVANKMMFLIHTLSIKLECSKLVELTYINTKFTSQGYKHFLSSLLHDAFSCLI